MAISFSEIIKYLSELPWDDSKYPRAYIGKVRANKLIKLFDLMPLKLPPPGYMLNLGAIGRTRYYLGNEYGKLYVDFTEEM